MKFALNKKQIGILLISIGIIGGISGLVYYAALPKPAMSYNFYGSGLQFRDDLKVANNIPVYPDENSVLNAVWNPEIQNISIAFINSSAEDNAIIAVNAFEVTYKLSVGYSKFNWFGINFVPEMVESFENLTGNNETLTIALVPPSVANGTSVEIKDGVIYISGETQKEFDLATIKFLMAALNITV